MTLQTCKYSAPYLGQVEQIPFKLTHSRMHAHTQPIKRQGLVLCQSGTYQKENMFASAQTIQDAASSGGYQWADPLTHTQNAVTHTRRDKHAHKWSPEVE